MTLSDLELTGRTFFDLDECNQLDIISRHIYDLIPDIDNYLKDIHIKMFIEKYHSICFELYATREQKVASRRREPIKMDTLKSYKKKACKLIGILEESFPKPYNRLVVSDSMSRELEIDLLIDNIGNLVSYYDDGISALERNGGRPLKEERNDYCESIIKLIAKHTSIKITKTNDDTDYRKIMNLGLDLVYGFHSNRNIYRISKSAIDMYRKGYL